LNELNVILQKDLTDSANKQNDNIFLKLKDKKFSKFLNELELKDKHISEISTELLDVKSQLNEEQ